MKIDSRQRKFSGERGSFQPRKPGCVARTKPVLSFIRRLDAGFQNTRDRLLPGGLNPDSRECVSGRVPFVSAVEDLPIAQLAAAPQADAPRANSSQRERDHRQRRAGKDPRIGDIPGLRGLRLRTGQWLGLCACVSGGGKYSASKGHGFQEITAIGSTLPRHRLSGREQYIPCPLDAGCGHSNTWLRRCKKRTKKRGAAINPVNWDGRTGYR